MVALSTPRHSAPTAGRPRTPAAPAAVNAYICQEGPYHISLCQHLRRKKREKEKEKEKQCAVLYLGCWVPTFSPLSDLTATSSVAIRTHTVTPGAC